MQSDRIRQEISGSHNVVTATGDVVVHRIDHAEGEDRRHLATLARKVRAFLNAAIQIEEPFELEMELLPDMLSSPWEQELELPGQTRKTIARGTAVCDVFDEMARSLLILGEPGAGKTTCLFRLAKTLLCRAESSELHEPIPVVFNLSCWTSGSGLFVDWLARELVMKYYLPKKIGSRWLHGGRILPLLDGLDEVPEGDRTPCVQAINHLQSTIPVPGIVVCSRREEYETQTGRLTTTAAIGLHSLTLEQVDDYLASQNERFTFLRSAIQRDQKLQSLVTSPLMLSILTSACDGNQLVTADPGSVEGLREKIFDHFISRMFRRKGKVSDESIQRTMRWLVQLADGMRTHSTTELLIDQLQPTWLARDFQRQLYVLSSRTLLGVAWAGICIISVCILAAFFAAFDATIYRYCSPECYAIYLQTSLYAYENETTPDSTMSDLVLIVAILSGIGIVGGAVLGLVDASRMRKLDANAVARSTAVRNLKIALLIGLIAITAGLGVSCLVFLTSNETGIAEVESALGGFIVTFFVLGCFSLVSLMLTGKRSLVCDIQPVESVSWSFASATKLIGRAGAVGAIIGLVIGLLGLIATFVFPSMYYDGTDESMLEFCLIVAAAVTFWVWAGGMLGGAFGFVLGGMTKGVVATKASVNQGTMLSIRNAGFIGSMAGGISMLILGGIGFGLVAPLDGLIIGIEVGLSFAWLGLITVGITACLWYGGIDAVFHYALRLNLVMAGRLPFTLKAFLDDAERLAFVRRAGNRYIFMHALLRDHFAELAYRTACPESIVLTGRAEGDGQLPGGKG